MTKAEIATRVANECNLTQGAAKQAVECVVDSIRESCETGEDVTIRGFGTFKVVTKAAKTARNISTGEAVKVASHKSVKFKPAIEFIKGMKQL